MICPECGKEVSGKFCSECGAPLKSASSEKPGMWAKAKEAMKRNVEAEQTKQREERERLAQLDREGIPYCPKCQSTSLSAHKKGFGFGKAAMGTLVAWPVGLAAGGLGSGKVRVTCLKCGYQFSPGKKR